MCHALLYISQIFSLCLVLLIDTLLLPPQEPRGQYVVDLIRAELTFEDPYALAAFFALVKKR